MYGLKRMITACSSVVSDKAMFRKIARDPNDLKVALNHLFKRPIFFSHDDFSVPLAFLI